jgi:hypothetical protein
MFHIMTVTSTSSEVLHSPSSICCLTPGERASIYTIVYHGENKIHFDKVLRSHHDLINRSEYFCHKGIGICTACRNHKRAVFSSFLFV